MCCRCYQINTFTQDQKPPSQRAPPSAAHRTPARQRIIVGHHTAHHLPLNPDDPELRDHPECRDHLHLEQRDHLHLNSDHFHPEERDHPELRDHLHPELRDHLHLNSEIIST